MENHAFLMVKHDTPSVIEKLHKDIDPEDVYEYGNEEFGLEKDTHVTLAPCLDNAITVVELKKHLNPIGSYSACIGELSMFGCPDFDVLKYDVTCQALHESNAKIGAHHTMHTEYTYYHPHMTVAYMKKGCAKKYMMPKYNAFPILYVPAKHFMWSFYDSSDNQQRINFL